MKTVVKILVLLISVVGAISCVVIFAKTKVAPPVILSPINQYMQDVSDLISKEMSSDDVSGDDEVFIKAMDRIQIFYNEGKIDASEFDESLDRFVASYSSRFLERCFTTFNQTEWENETHNYILVQSALLKGITHSDRTRVIQKSTLDSLDLAASIISDYRDATRVSHIVTFTGYENANVAIHKASSYASNKYLMNCRKLMNDLIMVKPRLAASCYNQVVAKIDELENYRYYSKDYYDNTLVPQVDQVVTTYDNMAEKIFGTKENVNVLWNRAKSHYNDAMSYYEFDN